jgi:hypothetical protein
VSHVLDTCILIDHLRNVEPATRFLGSLRSAGISALTWMEVLVGARDEREQQALRAFLSAYDLLSIDDAVTEEAVRLRRSQRLKLPDAIILATARVHGRELATRNTRDFPAGSPGVFVPYQ